MQPLAIDYSRPLAIDLFTGLHGWAQGLVDEGWRVVGFDIEDMCGQFGLDRPKHVQLVLQDVLTIHGKQFRDASLIVASPPCQTYSYMAMPWSKAKQMIVDYETGVRDVRDLTALFDACFRIQREACAAAGHHIPLVVENVRGAQRWVGRSRWNFGSYHLWGDVPALMPIAAGRKSNGGSWFNIGSPGQKETGRNPVHEIAGVKVPTMGAGWYPPGHPKHVKGLEFNGHADRGVKGFTPNGERLGKNVLGRTSGSKSTARKMASAMIAKIPLVLSRHIARTYYPET